MIETAGRLGMVDEGTKRRTTVCDATECGVILSFSPNRRPHVPFIPVHLRSSSHNSGIFCCGGAIDRDGRKVGEGAERFVPSLSLSLADRTNTLAEGNGRQKTVRVHDDDDCLAAGVAVSPLPLLLLLMMVIIIVLLRYERCTITTLFLSSLGWIPHTTIPHDPYEQFVLLLLLLLLLPFRRNRSFMLLLPFRHYRFFLLHVYL